MNDARADGQCTTVRNSIAERGSKEMLIRSDGCSPQRLQDGTMNVAEPDYDPANDVYESMREAVESDASGRNWARWQSAITLPCLIWFAMNAIRTPPPISNGLYQWLNLFAAAALVYGSVQLGAHYRAELHSRIALLCTGHTKMRTELTRYIGLVEKSGLRVDHEHANRLLSESDDSRERCSSHNAGENTYRGESDITRCASSRKAPSA